MAGKDCKINMYAQKHPVRGVYDEKIGAGGPLLWPVPLRISVSAALIQGFLILTKQLVVYRE